MANEGRRRGQRQPTAAPRGAPGLGEGLVLVDGDGCIETIASGVERALGFAPGELVGRAIDELFVHVGLPEDGRPMARTLRDADGVPIGAVMQVVEAPQYDGAGVAVLVRVVPNRPFERGHATRLLYAGALDEDGRWLLTSLGPNVERFIGCPPEDTTVAGLELAFWDRTHPNDAPALAAFVAAVSSGSQQSGTLEYRIVGGDGVVRWVHEEFFTEAAPLPGARRLYGFIDLLFEEPDSGVNAERVRAQLESARSEVIEAVYTSEWVPGDGWLLIDRDPSFVRVLTGSDVQPEGPLAEYLHRHVHPDDLAAWEAWSVRVLQGVPLRQVYRVVDEDGSVRWIVERSDLFTTADGRRRIEGSIMDVTALREAVDALADVQRDLTASTDAGLAHGYLGSIESGAARRSFLAPAAAALIGGSLPPEVNLDAALRDALHPEDRERFELAQTSLAQHGSLDIEYRLVGLDGRVRHAWERAELREDGRVIGLISDVSERRRLAADLLDAESRATSIIASVDDLLFQFRIDTDGCHELVYASPGLARYAGMAGPFADFDERSRAWLAALHPDDRAFHLGGSKLAADFTGAELSIRIALAAGGYERVRERIRVHRDYEGRTVVSGVLSRLEPSDADRREAEGSDHELTPRQLEVVRLLAEGLSTPAIATELVVSTTTVRNHVHAVLRALDAHTRLEAVAEARRRGLL